MIGLIWAEGRNKEIGTKGELPWHLPEDLAFFKSVTAGHPVIMGRATWDSLPPRFRPLPGRRNIVVTRNPAWGEAGAERAGSLEEAIKLVENENSWVIGGASMYRAALPLADTLAVTSIDVSIEDADAFAPKITSEWLAVSHDPPLAQDAQNRPDKEKTRIAHSLTTDSAALPWHVSANGLRYRFTRYIRASRNTGS